MAAFETDKEQNYNGPSPTETVQQATPVERIFMIEAKEMRARLDRIGQITQSIHLVAAGTFILLCVIVYFEVHNGK